MPPPPELMAPAGSADAGYAALHYGATAVYLGLRQFSARADAANFSLEELDELTAYAHSLKPRRKVFVALNTLILQNELPGLVRQLGLLSDIRVDALIIQDLGIYRIVKEHFPEFRLHASTQMAVHNRAGVETLRDLGFARVTLARELTLEEVRDIVRTVPGVETEIFIHGALCYSYSGLCLFSSHQLGRSGNRGRCAYLCRDRFRADTPDATGNERFAFSMKDLALTDALPDLCASGISSLKIEGRMKSPLYVAATTNYYRKRMDGRISPAERKDLESDIQTIFSRPWTPLYIRSRDEKEVIEDETVGHRGATVGIVESVNERGVLRFRTERALELHDGLQIDLPGASRPFGFPIREMRVNGAYAPAFEAAAGSTVEILLPEDRPEIPRGGVLFHASSQKVKQRYPFDRPRPGVYRRRQPVHGAVEVRGDRITARIETDAGDRGTAERVGEFGLAKNPGKTEEAARIAFEKLGDTPFELRRLDVVNPDSLFVPVSQWNELRRQTAADLSVRSTERSDRRIRMIQEVLATPPPMAGTAAFRWSLKVDSLDSLADFGDAEWADLDEVVVDIGRDPIERLVTCLNRLPRERLRLALPMISRSWEIPDLTRKIRDLLQAGCTRWEAANLSAWRLLSDGGPLPDPRIDFSTDWSVYVTNSEAARQALDLGATRFTLSPEDGIDNMRELLTAFGPQATLIVYQDTPLFISESGANAGFGTHLCSPKGSCPPGKMDLISSHGDRVRALHRDGRTVLIGRDPLNLSGQFEELRAAGARSLRADFIYQPYSPAEVRSLWMKLRSETPLPRGHIGNFERGMQG